MDTKTYVTKQSMDTKHMWLNNQWITEEIKEKNQEISE